MPGVRITLPFVYCLHEFRMKGLTCVTKVVAMSNIVIDPFVTSLSPIHGSVGIALHSPCFTGVLETG